MSVYGRCATVAKQPRGVIQAESGETAIHCNESLCCNVMHRDRKIVYLHSGGLAGRGGYSSLQHRHDRLISSTPSNYGVIHQFIASLQNGSPSLRRNSAYAIGSDRSF